MPRRRRRRLPGTRSPPAVTRSGGSGARGTREDLELEQADVRPAAALDLEPHPVERARRERDDLGVAVGRQVADRTVLPSQKCSVPPLASSVARAGRRARSGRPGSASARRARPTGSTRPWRPSRRRCGRAVVATLADAELGANSDDAVAVTPGQRAAFERSSETSRSSVTSLDAVTPLRVRGGRRDPDRSAAVVDGQHAAVGDRRLVGRGAVGLGDRPERLLERGVLGREGRAVVDGRVRHAHGVRAGRARARRVDRRAVLGRDAEGGSSVDAPARFGSSPSHRSSAPRSSSWCRNA